MNTDNFMASTHSVLDNRIVKDKIVHDTTISQPALESRPLYKQVEVCIRDTNDSSTKTAVGNPLPNPKIG